MAKNRYCAINLNRTKNARNPSRELLLTNKVTENQAKIVKELLADGRKSDKEIAEKIGLTKAIVRTNYNKLEKAGIITGATTHINYKLFGYKAVAHILINVDSHQADQLIDYLQKMPEIYAVSSRGPKGEISAVTILKTFEQLNEVKDHIKRKFSVVEMRTAIWTDVKEMNENLAIIPENRKTPTTLTNIKIYQKKSSSKTISIDEIDQKIADILAENGRTPMESLGRQLGISSEAAKKRYEKLRDNGFLKVTIQVNPQKIGYHAMCVFFTVTSHEDPYLIIERIKNIPDIISIMKTTGDYDLQIWAMIQDLDQLLALKEKVEEIPGLTKIDIQLTKFGEKWEKWPTPRQYISTF